MASRFTGVMRVRMASPAAKEYMQAGRLLVGMLMEQLGHRGLKQGQLIRTLPDGTVLRALYDGTMPILEIDPRPTSGGCEGIPPDVVGLACTVSEPDEYVLPTPAWPSVSILGWRTARYATGGLTADGVRGFWNSGQLLPEEPTPVLPDALASGAQYYDLVPDNCGTASEVHPKILMGNSDWHDETQSKALTCHTDNEQRYAARGNSNVVYFRGRVLANVSALRASDPPGFYPRYVCGMAFRWVEDDTGAYWALMVVVSDTVNFALYSLPVTWNQGEPHASVAELTAATEPLYFVTRGETETSLLMNTMWHFNASGTEARRIRSGWEEQLTLDAFATLGSATEGDHTTAGNASAKYGYWVLHNYYFQVAEVPGDLQGWGEDEHSARRTDLGQSRAIYGDGTETTKIAVDWIGDTPEYLTVTTTGGTDNFQRAVTPVFTYTSTPPAGISTSNMVASATATEARNYTTPLQVIESTTWGEVARAQEIVAESVNDRAEFLHDTFSDTDFSTYSVQSNTRTLSRDLTTTSISQIDVMRILYYDLRYGLFVTRRTEQSTTTTLTHTVDLTYYDEGGTHLGDNPIRRWEPNTLANASTTEGSSQSTTVLTFRGDVIESYAGAPVIEQAHSETSGQAFDPDAHVNNTAQIDALVELASGYVHATLGVDFDSTAVGFLAWYESDDAVYATTPLSSVSIGSIPGTSVVIGWADNDTAEFETVPGCYFGVYVDIDDEEDTALYLSMPLPQDGPSEPWRLLNRFPFEVEDLNGLPLETTRYYPMALITPAFVSAPPAED